MSVNMHITACPDSSPDSYIPLLPAGPFKRKNQGNSPYKPALLLDPGGGGGRLQYKDTRMCVFGI